MIITGATLLTAASMIAANNIFKASWTQLKLSIVLGVVGFGLIAAGLTT